MRQMSLIRLMGWAWLRRRNRQVHVEVIDASWHVDTEAICPDCLGWIGPTEFVRRNASTCSSTRSARRPSSGSAGP